VRVVNGAFALAVVLVCGEVRVIFPSFAHYIHFPPPLNYLLVSLALFGLAFGFAAHLLGLVTGLVGTSVLMTVLLVSAVAGSLVLGMPLTMLPAPAIAAVYLAHFHSSRSLTSYLIFAAAAAIAATWFVLDHFFFLALSVAGVPLRSICQGMLAALLLALLVPAATLLHRPQRVAGVLVVLQALLFAWLESLLYNGDGRAEEGVYPSFLVVTTTVAGLAAVQRLHAEHKIGAVAEWVGSCVYLAKLPMLAVSSPGATFSSLLLLLAVTPPFFLYRDKAHARSRMRPGVAVAHAAAAVAAVVHARFMLFDIAMSLTGHRPSHALLIGALLLAAIAACLPILLLHFPHSMSARRAAALAAVGAALFMCLQPPLPPTWRTLWDSAHFPDEDDPDDSTIYALPTHGPLWPAWLLLSLILSGLAAFLRAIPIGEVEAVRVGYAVGMGVATGVYLQAEFFLFLPLLPRALLFLAAIAGALFLVLAHRPPSWIPPHSPLLPGLFALQAALLPLTYLAVGRAALVEVQGEGEAGQEYDLYDDTRRQCMCRTSQQPVASPSPSPSPFFPITPPPHSPTPLPSPSPYFSPLPSSPPTQAAHTALLGIYCVYFLLAALLINLNLSSPRPSTASSLSSSSDGSGLSSAANGASALPQTSPFAPKHRSFQVLGPNALPASSASSSLSLLQTCDLESLASHHLSHRSLPNLYPHLPPLTPIPSLLPLFLSTGRETNLLTAFTLWPFPSLSSSCCLCPYPSLSHAPTFPVCYRILSILFPSPHLPPAAAHGCASDLHLALLMDAPGSPSLSSSSPSPLSPTTPKPAAAHGSTRDLHHALFMDAPSGQRSNARLLPARALPPHHPGAARQRPTGNLPHRTHPPAPQPPPLLPLRLLPPPPLLPAHPCLLRLPNSLSAGNRYG
ncbi:unnamed protein product, partial [Closterium sp. NIES-54]